MKKDQLIMLDTCVVKYLLNIKGNNDEAVSKNLKEKTIKNYIRHHACCISVFTLFELLRNPLNEQNIKDMKKCVCKFTHHMNLNLMFLMMII